MNETLPRAPVTAHGRGLASSRDERGLSDGTMRHRGGARRGGIRAKEGLRARVSRRTRSSCEPGTKRAAPAFALRGVRARTRVIPIAATLRDGLPFLSLRVRLWLWTVLVFAVVQVVLALAWLALASDAGLSTRLPELFLFTLPVGLIAAGIAAWRLAGRAVAPISKLAIAAQSVSPANL